MLAEARIVAGVGVALGLLASLATIVPFGVARHEGLVPDGRAVASGGGRRGRRRADPAVGPLRGPPHCSRGGLDRRGPMTDWASMASPSALLQPIRSVRPAPVDGDALVDRLRMTAVSLGYALLMAPALALGILTILAIPLGLVAVGFVIAAGVVPATAALTALHRRLSGQLLGETIHTAYADTTGLNPVTRPMTWLTDRARWRDVGFLWFSATGGFVMSILPVGLLVAPVTHVVGALLDGGTWWWLLVVLDVPLLLAWWCATPGLVRGRALAERNILGSRRVEELERRIEEVADVTLRDARPQRRGGAPDRARPARRRPGPDRLGRHERRPGREAHEPPTPRPPRRCCARPGSRR